MDGFHGCSPDAEAQMETLISTYLADWTCTCRLPRGPGTLRLLFANLSVDMPPGKNPTGGRGAKASMQSSVIFPPYAVTGGSPFAS